MTVGQSQAKANTIDEWSLHNKDGSSSPAPTVSAETSTADASADATGDASEE